MSTAHMTCTDCGAPAVLRVDPYYRRHELLCRACATPPLLSQRCVPPVRSVPSQQQSHEDADRPFQATTPRPKQDP